MTVKGKLKSSAAPKTLSSLVGRVSLAWFAFVGALILAVILGDMAKNAGVSVFLTHSLVVSGLIIPTVCLLRRYGDPKAFPGLGLALSGAPLMLLAAAGVWLLAGAALALSVSLGWMRIVSVNLAADIAPFALAMLAYVFFYEALPEELVFRGYIFSKLNTVLSRRLATLGQIALFVAAPIAAALAHAHLFGGTINLGGADRVTFSYILVLVIFGSTLQFCRTVTGSLWTSIGFHLGFVSLSRLIGAKEKALIQIENLAPRTMEEVVIFLGALVMPALLLLIWAVARGRTVGRSLRAPPEQR